MSFTKFFCILDVLLFAPSVLWATDFEPSDTFKTTEEVLQELNATNETKCAYEIFANALVESAKADAISEYNTEKEIEAWAQTVIQSPNVLKQILECPEVKSVPDDTNITFTPVIYEFENGRTITINYTSQPKILRQHILLALKPKLPSSNINPDLMDLDNNDTYTNTEPAWYAIMVVQHGVLSEYVGPNKNNTLSVKWIDENISKIYPKGYYCTSKSALANNSDTINRVVHNVVNAENDSNDYYVAGDVNLGWIMYAEIAADVIITAVTFGGGAVVSGTLKSIRSTKAAKGLVKSIKKLTKIDKVKDYMQATRRVSELSDDIVKLEKNIKNANNYEKALKNAEKARKAGRIKDAEKYEKEAHDIFEASKKIDTNITTDALKNVDKLKKQRKTLTTTLEEANQDVLKLENPKKYDKNYSKLSKENKAALDEATENITKYKENSEALTDLMEYRRKLQSIRRPRGNVITRTLRSFSKAQTGTETIDHAAHLARAGLSSRSAKISDWLFHSTLKTGSRLAKFEEMGGLLYGAVSFLGDMYDQTSTTSKEFSNGIDFKPLCLLSADDIKGQENVVNYGMWLMWEGNSTDSADDDAAFLQSMDFASKFFYQLDKYQDEHGAECDVDIYVVRPIIKLDEINTENPKGELFWLFMNDIPWSTHDQFHAQVPDIQNWQEQQKQLEQQDSENKYGIQEKSENIDTSLQNPTEML